jgi:hypothetical protein
VLSGGRHTARICMDGKQERISSTHAEGACDSEGTAHCSTLTASRQECWCCWKQP